MKRITVFCGSSSGHDDYFCAQAEAFGHTLAVRNIGIVYGGARIGMMGALANGALAAGGEVIGVIPGFLRAKEIAHEGLRELVVVDTMHERKVKMHELSDGVVALPGGFGTMDEFFEMLTWGQLGLHAKPIGLYNISGFYDNLIEFSRTMVDQGFLNHCNRQMILDACSAEELLDKMERYTPPAIEKWVTRSELS
ncbi:MAG TPA: TIGR00730 family Rossman fold protein [Bacteroidota bacterium]|nr:TIGR00730 family Rossman fold protein [Bacteroidota bacterium]